MSPISLVVLLIAPITCHRLIVSPPDTEWDSVVVQSDPIKITEGKGKHGNDTREPDYAIRLNKNTISDDESEARSGRNCKYNDISCLYGTEAPNPEPEKTENQEIIDRFLEQYSAITNAKFGTDVNRTDVEEKSYWNSPRPTHPFDDKKNWVTLETVPWSTSMVSKWQPNLQPTHPSPSSYEPPPQQPHRPSEDKPWHYGGMSDKPVMPTMQTWTTNRPAPVTTNYGSYTPVGIHYQQSKPSTQWGIGNNDIITDNRPSNFPAGNNGYQSFHSSTPNHYQTSPPSYQQAQHMMTTHEAIHPTRYPSVTRHPSTYPDVGNGEWVLLSTTKGYSLPSGYRGSGKTMYETAGNEVAVDPKHGRNPEISRYHEEDIDFERKPASNRRNFELGSYEDRKDQKESWDLKGLRVLHSENGSRIYAKDKGRHGRADWNMEQSPLQILYSSTNEREHEPAVTMRRTVRLQVLPPVSNVTTLAHDGLLEIDPSSHSVDEHKLLEEEKIKQLSKIAKVRRSNFTLYRVIPAPVGTVTGKSVRDKSAAVLAAVGAGMIPATMAMLVPMALGRKRRSVTDKDLTFNMEKTPADW